MRTIVNNPHWRITAFGTPAYIQERALINVTLHEGTLVNSLTLVCGDISATYYIKYGNTLVIDASDLVRMYQSGATITITHDSNTATLAWTYGGLIDPRNLTMPLCRARKLLDDFCGFGAVMPPTVNYASLIGANLLEFRDGDGTNVLQVKHGNNIEVVGAIETNAAACAFAGGEAVKLIVRGAWGDNMYDGLTGAICMAEFWRDVSTPDIQYEGDSIDLHHGNQNPFYFSYNNEVILSNIVPERNATTHIEFTFIGKGSAGGGLKFYNDEAGNYPYYILFDNEGQTGAFEEGKIYKFACDLVASDDNNDDLDIDNISIVAADYAEVTMGTVRPLLCGQHYACVQWVGRTGVIKRATFEVRKVTDTVPETVEIERADNAYDVRKGYEQTLQLVMPDLGAYDYWYYSDILTSGDVRAVLDDHIYDTTILDDNQMYLAEKCKVQVTDKKIQQLDGDGGKQTSLAITINYKRYDTI